MGVTRVRSFRSLRSLRTVGLTDGSTIGVEIIGPVADRKFSGLCETLRGGLLLAYFASSQRSQQPRPFYLQQGQLRIALDEAATVVHRRWLGLSRLRVSVRGKEYRWSKYIGHLALFRRGYSWPVQSWDSYDFLRWVADVANDPEKREWFANHYD